MSLHLQVKLLQVLEDRRVGSEKPIEIDVRIMAATNREVKREVDEKTFRANLYYRLAVVTLAVPPLRERLEDLPDLPHAFLERSRRQLGRHVIGFRPDAMQAMLRHQWPGNVRERINVIERAVLLAPRSEIRIADLRGGESWTLDDTESTPSKSGAASAWQSLLGTPFSAARVEVLHAFEHDYLERILDATKGRVGESARLAGLNERTLYGIIKRHGLRKEHFKETPGGRSR